MDTMRAYVRAVEAAARKAPFRVFDWDKAAKLIKELHPDLVEAGLSEDWEYTGGTIYQDGQIVLRDQTYVYLESNWAIPEICMNDGLKVPCWVYKEESPGWDASTYWPESALKILGDQVTS